MVTAYRAKHARHPHDDAPDTAEIFRRIAELPDGPEKEELRGQVVCAWMPMARRLAGRFRDRGEPLEDLQQTAALGLVKAVAGYDAGRGTVFESYAIPTIVGEIKRHFRDHTWDLHVPRRVQHLRNRVRASSRELISVLGDRAPTVAQIAEHSGLTEEEVLLGMEALESYTALSLDAELPAGDNGFSLQDVLGECDAGYDQVVHREAVKPHLCQLPERERRILYLRFFCDMTQSCIADELGISQMHVSRLLHATCERIHRRVEGERAAERAAQESGRSRV
ncbi:SigB/SigF/SigG family RNA polymerase sigma factor [Streptomyces sp. JJ36]|uniref:SigB/SigF/SigG family RNA polymerase sigma factor n=1 Tax=Streptomyces sp. JJ36 TaxID=2736645 RepID=UPI001F02EB1C|nr:SigB/SigF/SigG family RNA polymerase sigma factor [Streptomyces sp. JJ36]MCF6522846.1 SigB/SigF/SigG family RNA polymerase sigma factor [Streptomyces sp. JJ36]